jgi:aldose 1-epimerase
MAERHIRGIQRQPFGRTASGEAVERIGLSNANGLRALVLTRGATLAALFAPDREGRLADVVLGFDDLAGYERSGAYLGCVVGRVANRIAGSRFPLEGETVELAANEGAHHLHGGPRGLDRRVFEVVELAPDRLRLRCESPHGDQGYPGRLGVEVIYTLEPDDALVLELRAHTDCPTPVNLSHHAYWNLSGVPGADVRDHRLESPAAQRVESDAALLPTGRLPPVEGTPWDFRDGARLGPRIDAAGGFDGHLVLPEPGAEGLRPAAVLEHPPTGRRLSLSTTQPGFQLYTAGGLFEPRGKSGASYGACAGICLEPQHPPDSVNQPDFPSVILRPRETYRQLSRFAFSAH